MWRRWRATVLHRLSASRRVVALLIYGGITVLAYLAAYLLRFNFEIPADYGDMALRSVPVLIAVRLLCARAFRLSAGRWRFVSTRDVLRLVIAVGCGTIVFAGLMELPVWTPSVPLSVLVLEPMLTMLLTAGTWVAYRSTFEQLKLRRVHGVRGARRVLVVGAGDAGFTLAHEMLRAPTGMLPIGFVDDNPLKWGTRMDGLDVIGATVDLPDIARAERADEIVIAIPSATVTQLREVVLRCESTGLPFKVLPGIREVLSGGANLRQLREVRIEDLLGREPVQLELPELAEDLGGRSVLITGAAGSIGSELARQAALHSPGTLVLFDQAETNLYYLELELRERFPLLNVVPVVGNIVDANAVERVFRDYAPERVFHAAAYKHVPMMETNPREAIRNNVIGTWRVAEAAGRHGTGRFVLVSTDKAVRPSSVMGATKRTAELLVLELQAAFPCTTYGAVRFGNVLGSDGSVIPIFRRQIEAGKPLTVTHPDATRYFMTIPEAVQLVLQASVLSELRGHIAMLDMGDPVRIVDLAFNLLRLSGAHRSEGGGLVFTGLRPGEKLHEELSAPEERTAGTSVSKVRLIQTPSRPEFCVLERVADWQWALELGEDSVVITEFTAAFPGVTQHLAPPSNEVERVRTFRISPSAASIDSPASIGSGRVIAN
jgi:FlaA1/EpsC-like NDP-sugar epimerase